MSVSITLKIIIIISIVIIINRVSLSSSGLLGTIHVNQPDRQLIKIQDPPASEAGVLRFRACATTSGDCLLFETGFLSGTRRFYIWLDGVGSQLQGLCLCLPSSRITGGHATLSIFGWVLGNRVPVLTMVRKTYTE